MASNYCCDGCGRIEGDEGDPCPECGGETYWCGEPCDPALHHDCCEEYWRRMQAEGLWDNRTGWTALGMREALKLKGGA